MVLADDDDINGDSQTGRLMVVNDNDDDDDGDDGDDDADDDEDDE